MDTLEKPFEKPREWTVTKNMSILDKKKDIFVHSSISATVVLYDKNTGTTHPAPSPASSIAYSQAKGPDAGGVQLWGEDP
jgi:hypothetical protein